MNNILVYEFLGSSLRLTMFGVISMVSCFYGLFQV